MCRTRGGNTDYLMIVTSPQKPNNGGESGHYTLSLAEQKNMREN